MDSTEKMQAVKDEVRGRESKDIWGLRCPVGFEPVCPRFNRHVRGIERLRNHEHKREVKVLDVNENIEGKGTALDGWQQKAL